MMKSRIGMLTVGQSPRGDIVPHMVEMIGNVVAIEKGALDGLSVKDIYSFAPIGDEDRLVTRLFDGTQVIVAKKEIIPLVQTRIHELNREGVEFIVLLCTGHFPDFESKCLVVRAQKIVDYCIQALVDNQHVLGMVVPLPEKIDVARKDFSSIAPNIVVASASPYGSRDDLQGAAELLRGSNVDLTVLHCMGFTDEHRRGIWKVTRSPTIVANSIVARTVAELLGT
jgi:protein AroM